ncbi:MAG: hypothetical protein WD029_09105 [Microthrixaceae bacterium]
MTSFKTFTRFCAVTLTASVLLLAPAACSKDSDKASDATSSSTTTAATDSGSAQVVAPIMLTSTQTTADLKVGETVVFELGDPGSGRFVATSSATAVVEINSDGGSQGTYSTNAGGKALSAGKATVTVVLEGGDTATDPVVYELTVS